MLGDVDIPAPSGSTASRPTAAAIDAALREMEAILGSDGLLNDPVQIAEFRDPFAPPDGDWYEPGAVLLPTSVEQVQAILRVANAHGTPVWTNGQGRNNGYGGPAPRVSGSFVLSLRRMNRVLDVDEESGWALVEPGVRFFDLYDHLRSTGSRLWMSVPDLGWGSIVGNTLDHGVGYTPMGDHMLVILALRVNRDQASLLDRTRAAGEKV